MSVRAWWARVRGTLRRRDALDREMEREMAFHVEMATKRNVERGMAPDVAARQANLSFGSVGAAAEAGREANRAMIVESAAADVRFAVRALRRAPSFALATLSTMALGIGASTAIFAVVDAVLLRPLPVPQPADFTYLGWVWDKGDAFPALTSLQYQFVRDHGRAFTAVAAYGTRDARVGTVPNASTTPVRGLEVSGDFFRTIGFTPRLGRAFDATELEAGDASVVILDDAVWRTRFGADPDIVGQRLFLDREARTVVGVMPANFFFPPAVGDTGFLVPVAVHVNPTDEGHNTQAIARLRHGTSDAARDAEIGALSQAFRAAYPALAGAHEAFRLYTHREAYAGGIRLTLWVLFGAVSLLLLIACANTATLLLVRASSRQREIAVRAAIGAGPARILQQLLTEGLVLAAISAVLGVVLGAVGLRAFLAVAPATLPGGLSPELDGRTLGFAVAVCVLTGLVFGLAAAVPSFRWRLASGLLGAARGTTGGGTRTREVLVLVETASAVVLLAAATVLAASFARLVRVDLGFDTDAVIAVKLGPLPDGYDAARRAQLADRLVERVRRLPGVEHAATAPNLPLERGMNFPMDTREHPELGLGAVELRFVSPDYFATLGVPLAGRDFAASDGAGGEPVAIVNAAFARRFWGEAPAIGRTIQIGHFKDRWLSERLDHQTRVIGVAGDMREIGLDRAPRATVLVPWAQRFDDRQPVLLVRGEMSQVAKSVRAEVLGEDPRLSPTVEPLTAAVSRNVAEPRFRALLIGTFAASALLLAAIGIYGVIAAVVQERRREIGVRLSLGATGAVVALGVVRRCLLSVGAGAAVGLAAFWVMRRSLVSMVYDTSPGDPRLLAVALTALALVALCAAWVPARRAARLDPVTTLRLD